MRRANVGWLVSLCLCLSACAARPSPPPPKAAAEPVAASPVIARIVERGTLVVGTSGDQPPLSLKTKEGEIIGLEADLAQAMAAAMGVQLRLVAMPFSELIPALESGGIDIVLSGMTMTPERNLKVAFVGPYFVSGKTVLARADRLAAVKDAGKLKATKFTIAVLRGSTSQTFAEQELPTAQLSFARDYDEAVEMLVDKKVDALIADYPAAVLAMVRHPEVKLEVAKQPLTFEPLGIALPASDPLLINWTENFLHMLQGSGTLRRLTDQWMGDGTWREETL
ncbi:MAG TPA: transporter substrate-binding domain-containing protein [Candidatus Kryptonia bacterium]|nr:transporter substrate-binding domain-containing protein [Candidatus Kryptonia bacterium]